MVFGTGRQLLAGGAILAVAIGATCPAQAQVFGFFGYRTFGVSAAPNQGISPRDVAGIVADEGMRLVSRPHRNGNVFVADAVDQRGWEHRLIIDAYSGDIVQSFGRGQGVPQQFAPQPLPAPVAPPRRLARAAPSEPYVVPGIGGEEPRPIKPTPKPKPKAAKKPPVLARKPVEATPLAAPSVTPIVPQPTFVPAEKVETPPKAEETPVAVVPPLAPAPTPAPAPEAVQAPAAEPSPTPVPATVERPAVNDVPVAPLYEPPAKPPAGKVNDVPVAPLD